MTSCRVSANIGQHEVVTDVGRAYRSDRTAAITVAARRIVFEARCCTDLSKLPGVKYHESNTVEERNETSKVVYTEQFPCMKCGGRMTLQSGRTGYRCPSCGQGWVFTWVTPDTPMLRRPALPNDKVD